MWSSLSSSSTRQPRHARPSRRGWTILILFSFLLIGLSGFVIGLSSIFTPIKCYQGEPRSVKVFLDGEGSDGGGGELLAREGGEIRRRHKVMAFVGIQTGFGSVGRRRSLRKTWMPSDREGLRRLEETTGLAFRFVIGRTKDSAKMSELRKEVTEYDDFLLLDIEEEYSKLPYKTLAFFKAASALFDSKFYVKADDDIYLRPDRLSLLLTKERRHSQIYLGCMKKGPVFTNPRLKWLVTLSDKDEAKLTEYDGQECRLSKPLTPKGDKLINDRYEPLGDILGKEYFFHAYGPIYALSAEVVASLVALRTNSFRMFSNEDVTIGAWMLAMNVRHENHKALCEAECTSNSIAVWDIPKCSGLCNPEKRLLELHQMESCWGNSSSISDG